MKFELTKDQIEKLSSWRRAIKKKYGKYGAFEFRFSPTGIGQVVKVFSYEANRELDLTEVEKW